MKRKLILLILTVAVLVTVGCSKKSSPAESAGIHGYTRTSKLAYEDATTDSFASESISGISTANSTSREKEAGGETDSLSANIPDAERKLTKRATISIRVENLTAAEDSVNALLKKYDGYAASSNIQENSHYYSLRIPANYYDVFLAETGSMGRLMNRYENTEDVTLRYYDLEGRLATKKELLKTYQSYLGKAKTIEEILSVEARISELQFDIEGTGIQFRNLANKIDYATVDLNLFGPVSSNPNQGLTFGEQVKQLFGGFGVFLSTVAMILLGIVIYGIPIILLLGLLFLIFFGKIGLAKKLWRLIKS
ncbi:MAG: DUF4349 domain-containing protein [Bacteroidetes bacterium]|nr:DUF4349 domain-containing protein [Bacteroidota bacterium]